MCEDSRFRELIKAHVKWVLIVLAGLSMLTISKGMFWPIIDAVTHWFGYYTINEASNYGNGLGGLLVSIGIIQFIVFSTAFFGFISGWVHCVIEHKIEEKRTVH